jgi:O-methyltransferase
MGQPQRKVNPVAPARWSLREILYRLRDPALVADVFVRSGTSLWDRVSTSEFSRFYRKVQSHTMCSNARLRALHRGVCHVVQGGIRGDLVECGCARGGSAALMALTLQKLGAKRRLWLLDTFAGLPAPTHQDPDYDIAKFWTGGCAGSLEEVQSLFAGLGVSDGVEFVPGLFQQSIPGSPVREIALLHIDADWYESVKTCLEHLYDKVTPGGWIQLDDYGYWKGARRAVDEFFLNRGLQPCLERVDYSGRVFRKIAEGTNRVVTPERS